MYQRIGRKNTCKKSFHICADCTMYIVYTTHSLSHSLSQCLDRFIKLHLWPFYLIYSGSFFTSALVFWYFYSNRFSICPAENLLLSFYCWLPGILMSNRFEYTLSFHFIAYLTFGICFPMETSKKREERKEWKIKKKIGNLFELH